MNLRGRTQTYGPLIGTVIGLLAAGLAFPMLFGTPTPETFTSAGPVATSPTGADAGSNVGDEDIAAGGSPRTGTATTGAGTGTGTTGEAVPPAAKLAPGEELTASDRGVTPEKITVGVLINDVRGEASNVGLDLGAFDPDAEEAAWKAYIDEVNAKGGILGRKIEPLIRRYEAEEDYQAVCRELTKDIKVFAVFSANFVIGESNLCVTREGETPMVAFAADSSREVYEASRGNLSTGLPSENRMITTFARDIHALGVFKGKKIGVLASHALRSVGQDFLATLKSLKVTPTHVSWLHEDLETAQGQIPGQVQEMKSKQVDLVVMVSDWFAHHTPFVQNAEAQLFFPRYAVSDVRSSTEDVAAQGMPRSYDGTIGITFVRSGEWRANKPESAPDKECRELYEKRSGQDLPRENDDLRWLVMGACGVVQRFRAAATLAGANLTRPGLSTAIQKLGPQDIPHTGGGSFGPGKLDGADRVRTKVYNYDCRCYQITSDFRDVR